MQGLGASNPRNRDTKWHLCGCVRPKEEVDLPVAPNGRGRALASWLIWGLSLGALGTSLAREHQQDDEAGGDNRGLQMSARSQRTALKNSRKVLIRLSGRAVRRSIASNGDAVGSTGCKARRHRFVGRPRRWPAGETFAPGICYCLKRWSGASVRAFDSSSLSAGFSFHCISSSPVRGLRARCPLSTSTPRRTSSSRAARIRLRDIAIGFSVVSCARDAALAAPSEMARAALTAR